MNNCEVKRYIWLDFNKSRLIISPLIAIAIVAIVYLAQTNQATFYKSLMITSGIILGLFLFLWATKQAAESITSEVNQQTWVFQRMSSVSAWDMTIGKLFGSTLYPWYSALFFIIAYLVGAFRSDNPILFLKYLIVILLAAIVVHSLAILVCLIAVRDNRFTGRVNKNSLSILSIILVYFLITLIPSIFMGSNYDVQWFSWNIAKIDWFILTSTFMVVWAIVGLYRNMRTELQYENGPVIWGLFLLTILLYVNGLMSGAKSISDTLHGNIYLWTSFIVLVFILFLTIGVASFDSVSLRKLFKVVNSRNRSEIMYYVPLWLITLIAVFAMVILILCNDMIFGPTVISMGSGIHSEYVINLLPLSVLILIVRDIAVIGLIKSNGTSKAEYYILMFLLSMYGLLPIIINLLGLKKILHIFWPIPLDGAMWQIIPGIIQIMLLVTLMVKAKLSIFARPKNTLVQKG